MKTFKMIRRIIRWAIVAVVLGGGALLYMAVEFPNHMAYMFDGGQHQRQVEQELSKPITPSVCYNADCRHDNTAVIQTPHTSVIHNTSVSDDTNDESGSDSGITFKSIKKEISGTGNNAEATITGKVVSQNGEALSGALVRARFMEDADCNACTNIELNTAKTDSNGEFSITVSNAYITPKGSHTGFELYLKYSNSDEPASYIVIR